MDTISDVSSRQLAASFAVAIPLAVFLVAIGRLLRRENSLYATGLVFSALVYPLFAVARGHRDRLWLEVSGLSIFSLTAFLGHKLNSRWLAFGWAGHAIWDIPSSSAPWWYSYGCAAFDFFWRATSLATFPHVKACDRGRRYENVAWTEATFS